MDLYMFAELKKKSEKMNLLYNKKNKFFEYFQRILLYLLISGFSPEMKMFFSYNNNGCCNINEKIMLIQ